MKKTLFLTVLFLTGLTAMAQSGSGFGIKGGLNYAGNGDYFDSVGDAYENPDKNLGYHLGVYGKLGGKIYLRPELVYTRIKSTYDNDDFKMSKLDAPVLVGVNVIGPLNVFAGPSFQYILDTDFEGVTLGDVENNFTVGLNIGAGVNLGKLGIDLRYERGFSENEVNFINTTGGIPTGDRIDTRPDQLILSLSVKI